MFRHTFKENTSNNVEFEGVVDEGTLQILLKFVKSSKLKIDVRNVQDVFIADDYLLMDKLKLVG